MKTLILNLKVSLPFRSHLIYIEIELKSRMSRQISLFICHNKVNFTFSIAFSVAVCPIAQLLLSPAVFFEYDIVDDAFLC